MRDRINGPVIVGAILVGVLLILGLNLDLKGRPALKPLADTPSSLVLSTPNAEPPGHATAIANSTLQPSAPPPKATETAPPAREYPIGEQVERNQMRIAAVWLPSEPMAGMPPHNSSADLVHIEADIKATEGNRNGFAQDEKIPYILVHYTIAPIDTPKTAVPLSPIRGTMIPMVARDGFHYGATIEMPAAGRYKLTYEIDPPSAGGLGRHTDVDPWWNTFKIEFDWDYPGPPKS